MANKRYPKIWEDAKKEIAKKYGFRNIIELNNISALETRNYNEAARIMAEDYESEIASLQKRIQELEAVNNEAIDLLRQSYSIIDKRPLLDKLTGKNPIPESQKSSWQKRTEKLLR